MKNLILLLLLLLFFTGCKKDRVPSEWPKGTPVMFTQHSKQDHEVLPMKIDSVLVRDETYIIYRVYDAIGQEFKVHDEYLKPYKP